MVMVGNGKGNGKGGRQGKADGSFGYFWPVFSNFESGITVKKIIAEMCM